MTVANHDHGGERILDGHCSVASVPIQTTNWLGVPPPTEAAGGRPAALGTVRPESIRWQLERTTGADAAGEHADVPVGVVDRIPAYRLGLVAALRDEGFDAEVVLDAAGWGQLSGRRALLLSVSLPEDSIALASLKAANEDIVLVALLREAGPRSYEEALRAGASGAVSWEAPPETVIKVLRAALDEHCLLPVTLARALLVNDNTVDVTDISLEEARWLQMLATGATVAELARHASYSEREMFRLLNRLYQRMGARNRMEALLIAARSGLLGSAVVGQET